MDVRASTPASPHARPTLGHVWLIAILLTGSVYSGLIFVVVGPILPNIAQHFVQDGGDVLAQWVMTVPAIGLVLGGLSGGWLLNRFSFGLLLPVLLLVYGIAGSAGLFLENTWLLLASRFLIGFCAVILSLGTTVLIADRFDDTDRAKMLGYKNSISSATSIVGMLLAGLMADTFGWRIAFGLYAISLVFVLPSILLLKNRSTIASEPQQAKLFAPLASGRLIYLGVILFGVLVMAPLTQVPFLLREIDITGAGTLSLILGFSSVGSTLGAFAYGRVYALLGPTSTLIACMALWGTGMLTLGTTGSVAQTIAGCLTCGIASGLFIVHVANLMVSRVAPSDRASAMGLLYVALFLGDFLTPLILVPLASTFGRHTAFLLLAIPCFVTAAGAFVAARRPSRAQAEGLELRQSSEQT
jgi:MFS family permease